MYKEQQITKLGAKKKKGRANKEEMRGKNIRICMHENESKLLPSLTLRRLKAI
jgi:hypothetical protein